MAAPRPSRIPSEVLSHPTQRIYLLSFFALAQAWKISATRSFTVYLLTDVFLLAFFIPFFRIPLLQWTWRARFAAILIFLLFDFTLTSQWTAWDIFNSLPPVVWFRATWLDKAWAITERRVRFTDVIHPSAYILGQHTIHILPHATAKLNPGHQSYCIDTNSKSHVHIPIVFNNTKPYLLSYSVADFRTGDKRFYNLTASQLISSSRSEQEEEDLEWEWADKWAKKSASKAKETAQNNKQHVYSLDVRDTGIVRLERVLDKDHMDVRLFRREAPVVTCPSATFDTSSNTVQRKKDPCVLQEDNIQLSIQGVGPLSLTYQHTIGKLTEKLSIQSISQNGFHSPLNNIEISSSSQDTMPVAQVQGLSDYSWANAQRVSLSINKTYTEPGTHAFTLSEVKDVFGNRINFEALRRNGTPLSPKTIDTYVTRAHIRSQVSFERCSLDNPVRKLRDRPANLAVVIRQGDDDPWTVNTRFTPTFESKPDASPQYINYTLSNRVNTIVAREPGFYEILGVQGWHCPGDVLVPSACTVVEQPLPTASISFTPVEDECAGEVGLKTHFVLSGTPPFRIKYRVLYNGQTYNEGIKIVQHTHDEHVFLPDDYGKFEYIYTDIADANYDFGTVKLNSRVKQTVHPLASAKFIGNNEGKLWSCEGDSVPVDVELHGIAPYSFDYEIVAGKSRETFSVNNVTNSLHLMDIPLPQPIAEKGGQISLSLVKILDGRGCRRSLSVSDLYIDVHRSKPTVSFYGPDNVRSTTIRMGEAAHLPLRLTGIAPWNVTYANYNASSEPRTVTINSPNGEMLVKQDGVFELLSVTDRHCQGVVNENSRSYSVSWLPRPVLALPQNVGKVNKQGVIIREPVCQGLPDSFDLLLQGRSPFLIKYDVVNEEISSSKSLQVVANRPQFPLLTSTAGRTTYTFTGVGDGVYLSPSKEGLLGIGQESDEGLVEMIDELGGVDMFGRKKSPAAEKIIRLSQDVLPLPDGWIEKKSSDVFCIGDTLSSDSHKSSVPNLILNLDGEPPFDVVLAVSDTGSFPTKSFEINSIKERVWPIRIPLTLQSVGQQEISVRSIRDGHGCENDNPTGKNFGSPKQIVQVAEIGSIAAIQPQQDHCVGDTIDFVLQGTPPWTVKYKFNGKLQTVVVHSSTFSRLAESPGEFTITSVAHRENSCPSKAVELTKVIHPLPRAIVSQGTMLVEDIREGEQSEIIFRFEGTPPFAFTYTRSDWRTKRVLETHTVTGVTEHSHSIFASTEGTYTVTFISDRFCSFPPSRKVESLSKESL